jgi:hypothetical protein
MVLPDEEIPRIADRMHRLKEQHPRAGVRSFLLPMEELAV